MLTDLNDGPYAGISPANLTAVGNRLFFTANDGIHGNELWMSDGTAAGTRQLRDINPGPADSIAAHPLIMADVNGVLLFSADDGTQGLELWRSDGTPMGTTLVKDINAGPAAGLPTYPGYSTVIGGHVFFAADDGSHPGGELWVSDGAADGTVKVPVRAPHGLALFTGIGGKTFANANGALIFTANDGVHGFEPWIIPADQIEDLEHHAGGGHHDGGDPARHHTDGGDDSAALVAAHAVGQPPEATPAILRSNAPSVAVVPGSDRLSVVAARPGRVIATALPAGPFGLLGMPRRRVLRDQLTPEVTEQRKRSAKPYRLCGWPC
jgi:ELWxxDGT repeat protein